MIPWLILAAVAGFIVGVVAGFFLLSFLEKLYSGPRF